MKKSLFLGVLVGAILLLGAVSYAAADSVTVPGSGTPSTASDIVTVSAAINPKLALTVVTPGALQTVDFGTRDPGDVVGPQAVNLTVQSNKAYDVSVTKSGDAAIGLSTTLAASVGNAKTAGQAFADSYSLNVPWTTDPGSYSATVEYTVVQN